VSISAHHQQEPPRITRQKTSHAAPPRQQQRVRAASKPHPQARAEPNLVNKAAQTQAQAAPATESSTSSAPPASLPPTPPTRDELLTGFFHNTAEAGLSYTLCILPAGDDRTRGEWELYEDYDPTKQSTATNGPRGTSPQGAAQSTRRRTTWSGRWSMKPERDNFGWVELIKTLEAVQENGRTDERQCLMTQCCPYNLTATADSNGSRQTVMGIMLNAFDRSGGLFLTRAL
jgi:hypothetical protein